MKNKILIILFVIAVACPNIAFLLLYNYIDTENHENRNYAEFPEINLSNLTNIPEKLNEYYMDRVPFKNQFTNLNSRMDIFLSKYTSKYKLFNNLPPITEGKDRWLFPTSNTEEEDCAGEMFGRNLYTEEELQELADLYTEIAEILEKQGCRMVFFCPPIKNLVYKDYFPDAYHKMFPEITRGDQLAFYLQENCDKFDTVFPIDEFMKYKPDYQLYFKYDTHWNYLGGYLGAKSILDVLGVETFPLEEAEISVEDEGYVKDLADYMGRSNDYTDDKLYKITNFRPDITYTFEDNSERNTLQYMTSDIGNGLTGVMLGDSMRVHMFPFLGKSFEWIYTGSEPEVVAELLLSEKPNVFIMEISGRFKVRQEEYPKRILEVLKNN